MPPAELQIAPVGRYGREEAIRFLVAGSAPAEGLAERARHVKGLLAGRRRQDVLFWQVLRGRRRVAAAMVLRNAGRFGTLFHTPAAAPGAEAPALARLARDLCAQATRDGLAFVQILLPPELRQDQAMLEEAGFDHLAELIYMHLDLAGRATEPGDVEDSPRRGEAGPGRRDGQAAGLLWRRYGEFDDGQLARLIARTYEGSLDCPALAGIRQMPDVLRGHRGGRRFCPQAWWIVCRDGQAGGCILVNDSSSAGFAEVVYMGVAPEMRGCGLGRAMLLRAATAAIRRGKRTLTLAVDSRNLRARQIYNSLGFREVLRRQAYVWVSEERRRSRDVELL